MRVRRVSVPKADRRNGNTAVWVKIDWAPQVLREIGKCPVLALGSTLELLHDFFFTAVLFVFAPVFLLANPMWMNRGSTIRTNSSKR
jgi:hypothetical protein